jgi:transcription initiation factor IIE alpha subunit
MKVHDAKENDFIEDFSLNMKPEDPAKASSEIHIIVKEVSKSIKAVQILKYLKANGECYQKEIHDATKMNPMTISHILAKLVEGNVVILMSFYTKNKNYYRLNPKFPVGRIFEMYNRHIGMILYQHVPLDKRISTDQLKQIPKFVSDCTYYGLTLDEGVEAVKSNSRKIVVENVKQYSYSSPTVTILSRKEQ